MKKILLFLLLPLMSWGQRYDMTDLRVRNISRLMGPVYAPNLDSTSTAYIVFYNKANGAATYADAAIVGYWSLEGDTIVNNNNYKVYMTDSVYLNGYAIPMMKDGDPLAGFLTLKKLGPGGKRQLALSSIGNAIDTLIAYGLDTSLWYFDGSSIRNKIASDVHLDTALTLTGLKAMMVAANDQFLLVLDSVSGNVYRTKLTSFIDTLALFGLDTTYYWDRDTTKQAIYQKVLTDKVGIGTNSPAEMLHVAGNIRIPATAADGSAGIIKIDATPILHTYHEKGDNNLFIGQNAGNFSLDSSFNLGVGLNTLSALTTGRYNTALGMDALKYNTTGFLNTALGMKALNFNTTGYNNTAVGGSALANITEATVNTAIGCQAMKSNRRGSHGVAVGANAMEYANNSEIPYINYNTAVGYQAMRGSTIPANNTGQYNTAMGYKAIAAMTSGGNNTGVGNNVLGALTTGGWNVAFGSTALDAITTTSFNSAFGGGALGSTTGAKNTALGYVASGMLQSGSNNVSIGYEAGYQSVTGSGNVFIGYMAGWDELGSNKLYIANSSTATPLIYGDFANDTVRVNGYFEATGGMGVPAGAVDHGGLTGLADDDHSQYALLAGRAGDKIVIDTVMADIVSVGTNNPESTFVVYGDTEIDKETSVLEMTKYSSFAVQETSTYLAHGIDTTYTLQEMSITDGYAQTTIVSTHDKTPIFNESTLTVAPYGISLNGNVTVGGDLGVTGGITFISPKYWIGIDSLAINTSDIYFIGYTPTAITLDTIAFTMQRRAGAPDVTVKIYYGVNMNSAGTAVVTAGNQITTYAGQTKITTFNNGVIPGGVAIWADFSAVAVKPKALFLTLIGH